MNRAAIKCLLFFLCLIGFQAHAQLDNSVLVRPRPEDNVVSDSALMLLPKQVSIQLEHLNFLRNNEYFLPIADGYTLFGYQLIPKVVYKVNRRFALEGGVFLRKDYGNSGFKEVEPIFTARLTYDGKRNRHHEFLLGTLDGGLAHQLVEPLYDFESQLTRRLESGQQWKFQSKKTKVDTWIDWRNMIYDYSPSQEEVWGGTSGSTVLYQSAVLDSISSYTVNPDEINKNSFRLSLPFQFTGYHKGGQIDTTNLPLVTYFNATSGLEAEWFLSHNPVFKRFSIKSYYLGFVDYSTQKKLPFTSGKAIYVNLSAKTHWFELMVSYWSGSDFTTWAGGKLYRSVGSSIKHPGYVEQERELLIFRLISDIEIYSDVYISGRLEPYLDLRAKSWEFSNALYLTYRGQLWKSKNR